MLTLIKTVELRSSATFMISRLRCMLRLTLGVCCSGRRVACTIAFLGYGAAHVQESIWSGRSWVVTLKHLFDSVIYAVLTTVRRRELYGGRPQVFSSA
jgi:hypothetical protein